MLNNDVKKFIEVFTKIYKNNELVQLDDSIESMVMRQIKPIYLETWNRYLSRTFDKYEDANDVDGYDDWYDNLHSIEDIDEHDIKKYSLLVEPLEIKIGNEEILMNKVYELYMKNFNAIKPYCKAGMMNACVNFNKANAEFSIWSMSKDTESKEYKKDMSLSTKVFTEVNKQMQVLTKQFNAAQGDSKDVVNIVFHSSKANAPTGNQKTYDKGGFVEGSSFERVLSITRHSVNVFLPSGDKVPESYLDYLFSIIPEQMIFAVDE